MINFETAYIKTTRRMIGTNFMWCSILLKRNESPIVAMKEITVIIISCNAKFPKENKSIVSLCKKVENENTYNV